MSAVGEAVREPRAKHKKSDSLAKGNLRRKVTTTAYLRPAVTFPIPAISPVLIRLAVRWRRKSITWSM